MKIFRKFIVPVVLFFTSIFFSYFIDGYELLPKNTFPFFEVLGSVLLIISLTWGIITLIRLSKQFFFEKYDISREDNLRSRKFQTQFNIIERVVVFLIIIIAIGLILMLFDDVRKIGISLFASAGIAGVIIGLAAQKVIGAILAGIQIALTQPIRLDDVVIIENEWGRIEEITLTYVVVRIWDQRRLIVPSTYFFEKPFQNWTRTSADILGTVYIYTDYKVSFDAMRKELSRLLENSPFWDKKVNVLQVTDANEKTLEIRALMSAKDSSAAWDLRVHVREKLIEFLQKNYPGSLPKTRITIDNENEPFVTIGGFGKKNNSS